MPDPRTAPTRTKIVATLGPASWDPEVLSSLLAAGVNTCRINCSHADHEGIRRQVARVRRASIELERPTSILLDLQGPKVRTGPADAPILLEAGAVLTVVMDPSFKAEGSHVGTTYPQMIDDVSVGDPVLFADGALTGRVEATRPGSPGEVDIRIDVGGELGSHKGINLPSVTLSIPCLTDKDRADLDVGLDVGVDLVALSFVQRPEDVLALRELLDERDRSDVLVIAKIEKPQAVAHIDAILDACDGVMVARGDLGVEVRIEKVPVYQKRVLAAAHRAGKLSITATQMLDSMERNPIPTRAETTDVANAILDGTDAVMLSGETAVGSYPVGAVEMMGRIAREVEGSRFFQPTTLEELPDFAGSSGVVVRSACYAASENDKALVVFSWSGATARQTSKARPRGPIFALTANPRTADQLSLAWGVQPLLVPPVHTTDDMIAAGERVLLERGLVQSGQEIVILAGRSPHREAANLMKIHQAGEDQTAA